MLAHLSVDLKGWACVWSFITSHLLVLHLFSASILWHKGLYQLSEYLLHAEGSLGSSLRVFPPDLLTLTRGGGVSADASVFRIKDLIKSADRPTGSGLGDGAYGLMRRGVSFFFAVVLLFSVASAYSTGRTAAVMDWCTADMCNVPWWQVKEELELNLRLVSVWERTIYFYGLKVSVWVEFVT